MKNIQSILFVLLLLSTQNYATTMYTLMGVEKVYPLVEIRTKLFSLEFKDIILQEVTQTLDELGIQHRGYQQRSLVVIVSAITVEEKSIVTIELLIGEEVQRIKVKKTTFAITYANKFSFIFKEDDDLEDLLDDTLIILLSKFSLQYKEDNIEMIKVDTHGNSFAQALGYETSYKEAVKKAKRLKKDIILILGTNYCPWCRKFEQRVLLQKEVNDLIQKNYIPLILNKNKDKFPKKYNNYFTPVVYFIDYETLQSYERVVGYNNREEFIYLIKKGK